VGHYFIQDPTSSIEVGGATTKAVNSIGISTTQAIVSGNLTSSYQYVQGGYTRWILGITTTGGPIPVPVLAKAETLSTADILKISTTPLGKPITVVVDNSTTPFTVLSVQ
jgi:hypothetical protein